MKFVSSDHYHVYLKNFPPETGAVAAFDMHLISGWLSEFDGEQRIKIGVIYIYNSMTNILKREEIISEEKNLYYS